MAEVPSDGKSVEKRTLKLRTCGCQWSLKSVCVCVYIYSLLTEVKVLETRAHKQAAKTTLPAARPLMCMNSSGDSSMDII